ncbi:MAG: hypothetical protein L0Y57_05930, partial [Beijerinckiaceae bacterium]|nr:hypothetical protein [Beijerinckiaceae bacterium]
MGAVEHFKTLCCLGLPPESAMIAATPLLHEIIPHGWTRWCLLGPNAAISSPWAENREADPIYREQLWQHLDSSTKIGSVFLASVKAGAIGWLLPLQGRDWLESAFYREIEAPLDACWVLDAILTGGGQAIGLVNLTRPRSARPFTVDDVQRLDRLRPWLAHALRPKVPSPAGIEDNFSTSMAGRPVRSGELIFTSDAQIIFQSAGVESLLRILAEEPGDYCRSALPRNPLPLPIRTLLGRISAAANGHLGGPPRMQLSSAHGTVTLEAKWLLPANTLPADTAKDPKGCLIAVTIELREHAIAHAARVLRESGATPSQMKVGIQLAMGKQKSEIADELGIKLTSVEGRYRRVAAM